MAARFAEHPEAVAETVRLAERLRFDLTTELGYRYPRRGAPTPTASWPSSAGRGWPSATPAAPTGARPSGASRRSWR